MSTSQQTIHRAVMVREVLDALQPHSGGRYLDATLGGATHSLELLQASAPDGKVLSMDVDPHALNRAASLKKTYGRRWKIVEANFRHIRQVADESGWMPFDGILFDLGISSDELEDPSKGLSFQIDGPLDMRLGPKANDDQLTAMDIVNQWLAVDLIKMLRNFGEERHAKLIAQAIIKRRKIQPFTRSLDLASVIYAAVPRSYARGRLHPATRTFQALRIAVNDELESLRIALSDAHACLAPGGAIAVISFHSLEDRIVKNAFKAFKNTTVSKKPIVPTQTELNQNPRARSAKLRVARKQEIPKHNVCPEPTRLL